MRRTGIDVDIHRDEQFVLFRLNGVVYARDVILRIEQIYGNLPDPWQFDMLFDVRGLINVFVYEDFRTLSERWHQIAGNYRPLRFAVVTTDPLRLERTETFAPMFENFEVKAFPTPAEAAVWLASAAERITPG